MMKTAFREETTECSEGVISQKEKMLLAEEISEIANLVEKSLEDAGLLLCNNLECQATYYPPDSDLDVSGKLGFCVATVILKGPNIDKKKGWFSNIFLFRDRETGEFRFVEKGAGEVSAEKLVEDIVERFSSSNKE
jgi:hypothetical protein